MKKLFKSSVSLFLVLYLMASSFTAFSETWDPSLIKSMAAPEYGPNGVVISIKITTPSTNKNFYCTIDFQNGDPYSITLWNDNVYILNYVKAGTAVSYDESFKNDPAMSANALEAIRNTLVPRGYIFTPPINGSGSGQKPAQKPAAPSASAISIDEQKLGTIVTIAGGGDATNGYTGDGGPATAAGMGSLSGLAVDESGNVYIAMTNRISKVDTKGVITTVAGGRTGFGGDGGAATSASFDDVGGITVDGNGNLYIADLWNNRIRKVDSRGIITTIAGNGMEGFSGDGGAAVSASMSFPADVALDDSGNIYIADSENHRVRKVDKSGIITTIAGNGTAGFSGDGGKATAASLYSPNGISLDKNGNVYIVDSAANVVRKVDAKGLITTVAGKGSAGYSGDGSAAASAELNYPTGIAIDSNGNIYIADRQNTRIRKVDKNGVITTVAGNGEAGFSGDGGDAAAAEMMQPVRVAVDANGNLYIADSMNSRVRRVKFNSAAIASVIKPEMPVGLSISITGATAALTWNAPAGASSYKVYYKKQNGKYSVLTTTNTSIKIPGLSKSTLYFFKVSALNKAGEGKASKEIQTLSTKPGAPAGLVASVSGNGADLTWKAVSGATSYKVYYKKANGNYTILASLTTKIQIPNLSSSQKYYFKVSAVSAAGEGKTCAEISKTIG